MKQGEKKQTLLEKAKQASGLPGSRCGVTDDDLELALALATGVVSGPQAAVALGANSRSIDGWAKKILFRAARAGLLVRAK